MRNSIGQRIMLSLLALLLLAFVGFQAWRYFTPQYKSETVYSYTVSESAHLSGIVLRDEMLLDDRVGDGIASYLVSDGTKVSTGSPIAELYRDKKDAEITAQLRELETRRQQLEKAQDPAATTYAHTDVINKQIFSELGGIVDAVNSGAITQMSDHKDELLLLMNTKQIAMGKQENYNDAIARVVSEQEYCKKQLSGNPTNVFASSPGYFSRVVDGFENKVDFKDIEELNVSDLTKLMGGAKSKISSRVGKLVVDHNWYFATLVHEDELARYKEGMSVTLDFNIGGVAPVPAVVSDINVEHERGDAVVLFRSDYINESLINLRVTQADVNFKSVSGLRVSDSAVRFKGVEEGVYIVRGGKLQFRPVTVLHKDNGFVICREEKDEQALGNNLQQYDDVVVEGAMLYDEKPIK